MPNKYEKQGYTAVRTDDDDHYSRYKEVTIKKFLQHSELLSPLLSFIYIYFFSNVKSQCQVAAI